MTPSLAALTWLAEAPADFAERARAVAERENPGAALQNLANFRLSAHQSLALARAIARCRIEGRDLAPLSGFRLGVLANTTFDLILDCAPAAAARHGVALELVAAPFDQVQQQALDPQSETNAGRLDGVLLAVDHRWFNFARPDFSKSLCVGEALDRLSSVVEALRRHGDASAILQTVPVPPTSVFGNYERRMKGSTRAMLDELNRGIVSLAEGSASYLIDTAALAERVGTDRWFDPAQWIAYKLPFSPVYYPIYAEMLGRLLGAIRGKARKCLVLDLDNTLWGGVLGDDGLEGIILGQGNARGEAHLALQEAALDLRARGVVLAVCSRNDDAVARSAFREHPEMLLREDHFAVFQANWIDKASNLEAIANTLNVGLDALVFVDDNPAERAAVRAALPTVAVPELPPDPAWYAWTINAAGYFEMTTFSTEDSLRANSYGVEVKRAEVMARARDMGDYLSSLQMVLTFSPFDAKGRPRIAQLINKTNQFNLTTLRYTEAEVEAMETDPKLFTLQVRLADRFGDAGMIGVVICRSNEAGLWNIDTWLMSCRVLGRRIEEAMLAKIAGELVRRGATRVIGRYFPTAKNAMVRDHYKMLGFSPVVIAPEEAVYELPLAEFVPPELPFRTIDTFSVPPHSSVNVPLRLGSE